MVGVLPPEIVLLIFGHVARRSTRDLLIATLLVCRTWRSLLTTVPSLWTHLDISWMSPRDARRLIGTHPCGLANTTRSLVTTAQHGEEGLHGLSGVEHLHIRGEVTVGMLWAARRLGIRSVRLSVASAREFAELREALSRWKRLESLELRVAFWSSHKRSLVETLRTRIAATPSGQDTFLRRLRIDDGCVDMRLDLKAWNAHPGFAYLRSLTLRSVSEVIGAAGTNFLLPMIEEMEIEFKVMARGKVERRQRMSGEMIERLVACNRATLRVVRLLFAWTTRPTKTPVCASAFTKNGDVWPALESLVLGNAVIDHALNDIVAPRLRDITLTGCQVTGGGRDLLLSSSDATRDSARRLNILAVEPESSDFFPFVFY